MKAVWRGSICALALALSVGAMAQDDHANSNPRDQNGPGLRPGNNPNQAYGAPPNVIPEGTRFIIKLKDTLDTSKMEEGKRFKAELREDLVTPSGLMIPKGKKVKGHVGSFERGYTGARLQLAMDEIETRNGWVPLIATVTGVPGDSSIKSIDDEGELGRKGLDAKRTIENAAIGAAVGAASGAVAGGARGAAVGAAVGAGLGSGGGLLIKGRDMKLNKDTQLEVRLNRDITVPGR